MINSEKPAVRRWFAARLLSLAAGAAFAAACTDSVGIKPRASESMSISPSMDTLAVGVARQLEAVVRDTAGQVRERGITWSSSKPDIARVSSTGRVQAVAVGTATISAVADSGGGAASVDIVVVPPAPVAVIDVDPTSLSLGVGQTREVAATLRDAGGNVLTGRTVSWESSNAAVATVNATGQVAGIAAGTAIVSARAEGKAAQVNVTVTPPAPPPPPVSTQPIFDASRHALILTDDFNGYANANDMLNAYPNNRGSEYIELVAGRGGNGGAARLRYGTGAAYDIVFGSENRLGAVGRWNGTLPQKAGPYTHFYFTTWFRTSAGANPAANDGSGIKGFMFWHSGGGRYQNAVNQLGHPDDATRGPKAANPDNATSGMNLYKTADGRAPLWSQYADGQWHQFTIEIYAGNDPSGHWGESYWVDGHLIYSDINLRVGSGTRADHYDYGSPVTHWMVFGNFVSEGARSPFFSFDVDDWTAWTDR